MPRYQLSRAISRNLKNLTNWTAEIFGDKRRPLPQLQKVEQSGWDQTAVGMGMQLQVAILLLPMERLMVDTPLLTKMVADTHLNLAI